MRLLIDSSSLISLSINCLLGLLKILKNNTGVKLMITEYIKNEVVDKALKIDRFMLSALRVSRLIDDGTIELAELDYHKADRLLKLMNSIYLVEGKPVRVVHKGEAQAMAAAIEQGTDVIVIDERITAALIEEPIRLKEILESRLHKKVEINEQALRKFKSELGELGTIKSSDLLAIAYEKGLLKDLSFKGNASQFLKAGLWGLKFAGCALSVDELNDYLKQVIRE